MKIAILHMASLCADIQTNTQSLLEGCEQAKQAGVRLLLTPEFVLCGMPLGDLLHHDAFYQELDRALARLLQVKGIAILFSVPQRVQGKNKICDYLIDDGQIRYQGYRCDEKGSAFAVFSCDDLSIALCSEPTMVAQEALLTADCILYRSLEPFYDGLEPILKTNAQAMTRVHNCPVICVRPLAGNDEFLYEGGSFVLDHTGSTAYQASFFIEQLCILDYDSEHGIQPQTKQLTDQPSGIKFLYHAIVFALQQYLRKSKFTRCCLGLSGGIDSALVLALAVEAVGAENCEVLIMPSQYSHPMSEALASQMARCLRVRHSTVPITPLLNQYNQALCPVFKTDCQGLTEENIQARIRGVLMMALSNQTDALLLATGNKSEEAVGYCTLYGDTNGGFAPIKDLYKTQVYEMARDINFRKAQEIIPQEIIARPPSAELRQDQRDQDSLPAYEELDQILALLLANRSLSAIVEKGFDEKTVKHVMQLLRRSEFKRQQGVVGPKLSARSFGVEWNYPMTNVSYFY